MQTSLPTRLRVLRAERGLTIRAAAELTGVAKETLSDLERGTRHPQDLTLAKIAKGYNIPVEELLEEPVLAGKAEAPEAGPEKTLEDKRRPLEESEEFDEEFEEQRDQVMKDLDKFDRLRAAFVDPRTGELRPLLDVLADLDEQARGEIYQVLERREKRRRRGHGAA